MPSANDFTKAALQLLNVIQPGEDPSSEDGQLGFDVLNRWVDWLGTQRLSIYFLTRTTKTLASGTASYTIGTGGDIAIVRPVWIDQGQAKLIQDTGATYPLEVDLTVLTDDEYAAWPEKTYQSGYARAIWYDHNWAAGLGKIYPLPIPNVGTTQLVLYTPTAVIEFAAQSTDYTFPPGYERAIVFNLSMELAIYFPAAVLPPNLEKHAAESLADLKRVNTRLTHVVIDALPARRRGPLTGSRFLAGTI